MKKRKIVTRSGRGMRGYFPSYKAGRMIPWESQVERDALLLFEFSPGVQTYSEYQRQEHYYDGPEQRSCYPDYILDLTDSKSLLIEVKPIAKLENSATKTRLETIANHFVRVGKDYRVLTDIQIRRQPLFDNLRLLSYHRPRYGAEKPCPTRFREQFLSLDKVTFKRCSEVFGEKQILQLMATGALRFNMALEILADTTLLSLAQDNDDTLFI